MNALDLYCIFKQVELLEDKIKTSTQVVHPDDTDREYLDAITIAIEDLKEKLKEINLRLKK